MYIPEGQTRNKYTCLWVKEVRQAAVVLAPTEWALENPPPDRIANTF